MLRFDFEDKDPITIGSEADYEDTYDFESSFAKFMGLQTFTNRFGDVYKANVIAAQREGTCTPTDEQPVVTSEENDTKSDEKPWYELDNIRSISILAVIVLLPFTLILVGVFKFLKRKNESRKVTQLEMAEAPSAQAPAEPALATEVEVHSVVVPVVVQENKRPKLGDAPDCALESIVMDNSARKLAV